MITDNIILTVIGFLGSGGILGGIYALLKLRPEAGQITVTAAQGAVVVQTGVITNLQDEIARLNNKVDQLEMENSAREEAHEESRKRIIELEYNLKVLQRSSDRNGRMTELARRRSHVLSNAFSEIDLVLDELLRVMSNHEVTKKVSDAATIRTTKIRKSVQKELNIISELEAQVTYERVTEPLPELDFTNGEPPKENETVQGSDPQKS